MNFKNTFAQGQQGNNKGLPTGLKALDRAIDGVQKKSIYGVAAGPKVGKSTLVDFAFVIHPILYCLEQGIPISIIYFSYEIDRVKKEFDFAAFFFYHDYQIDKVKYEGVYYPMSARYLLGKLQDDNGNTIPVLDEHKELLNTIYEQRIVPLFGEYDEKGNKLKEGVIIFMEDRDNPTGMRNTILDYAKKNGQFTFQEYEIVEEGKKVKKQRLLGYIPKDKEKRTIIITDHIRKLKRERGYSMKENMDKWIEYTVELRNFCHFTFVHIVHLNRSISNIERLKFNGEFIYPTGEDVKDSGNLSEECDYLLTLFNPTDEKYGLEVHFGHTLSDYPNYRSIHLVESRDTECPQHLAVQMLGNVKHFKTL
jgi:hypothetical protein